MPIIVDATNKVSINEQSVAIVPLISAEVDVRNNNLEEEPASVDISKLFSVYEPKSQQLKKRPKDGQ